MCIAIIYFTYSVSAIKILSHRQLRLTASGEFMCKNTFVQLSIILLLMGCSTNKPKQEPVPAQSVNSSAKIGPDSVNSTDILGSDSGKIDGLKSIHFRLDKADLDKSEKSVLLKDAQWMKSHSNVVIQIEGHCDERGSESYNAELGERRAKVVYKFLVHHGVHAKQLTTISYGKDKPLMRGHSEDDYSKNRRDNFFPTKV